MGNSILTLTEVRSCVLGNWDSSDPVKQQAMNEVKAFMDKEMSAYLNSFLRTTRLELREQRLEKVTTKLFNDVQDVIEVMGDLKLSTQTKPILQDSEVSRKLTVDDNVHFSVNDRVILDSVRDQLN